ncbi:MAG: hypothetical protein ACRDHK_15580, partial [Actinomycetota bacterium]
MSLVIMAAVAGVIVFLVTRDGGDDTATEDPSGVERVLPEKLPDGFKPLEVRSLPVSSPFTEGADSSIQLRVFGIP